MLCQLTSAFLPCNHISIFYFLQYTEILLLCSDALFCILQTDQCVGQLWEFIFGLLMNPATNPSVICWEDESKRLFRIVNTETIARLWGKHKGNEKMTYANMSRTMR